MMMQLHSTSLPRIYNYADAVAFVDSAPERPGGWKALNPKRKYDDSKRARRDGESVIFRYHRTDVVVWHSPDHIEIEYFNSKSTATFIDCLSPLSARMWRNELYVEGVQPKKSSVHFYREHGDWKPDLGDVQPQYKFSVDRKRANAVRKIINPVIEFRQAYRALCPGLSVPWFGDHVVMKLLDDPPKNDTELVRLLPHLPSDDKIITAAFVHKGAIKKVPLPLGTLPKPSKWQAFSHLIV